MKPWLRRALCGLTPWTPHVERVVSSLNLLYEIRCTVCDGHFMGHRYYPGLLRWDSECEDFFERAGCRSGAAQAAGGEDRS